MDNTELYKFLEKYTSKNHDDSMLNNSLSDDYGIYGDDADDLILDFSKKFNVDVSEFQIEDYFGGEGDVIFKFFANLFNKQKPKKILTINDLRLAIISGRLV
ncbi:DUF1493 family protein [Pedobacter cryoconitis]|nr:DUF1493 family protein [Pedobacter cryoconitis]